MSTKSTSRTGRILSTLAVLLLGLDAMGKLLRLEPVLEGTAELGFSTRLVFPFGVILLLCVAAYAIPRSSVLGAVLLTGYLGGAIAAQFRVGAPLLTHILFPCYVAAFVWGGLFLREARVRALLPLRSAS